MDEATRQNYSAIQWRDIIDFRNLLVHEYFRINLQIVWAIVEHQIPILKSQINTILTS
jgi:uncharacterized protein with HEPN domain